MMKQFNHFDILAPYYDRFIKPINNERLQQICRLPAEGRLLDAGGGTGGKTQHLVGLVTTIVIADSSPGMLSQTKMKSGLVSVCSETERLPFRDQSFTRIVMIDALHHVADYLKTIGELWRVLTPGGWIVIEEPDIDATPVKIMAILEKLALMRSHFVAPKRIAGAFDFPNAEICIDKENNTAWVVVNKLNGV
jgi:ubiquinone/menaquinone biosynthesis C-methylase UbiE